MGWNQLRRISKKLLNYNFTTFLVYPSKHRPFFKIKQVLYKEENNVEVDVILGEKLDTELNFLTPKNSLRSTYIENIENNKNQNIENLKKYFVFLP